MLEIDMAFKYACDKYYFIIYDRRHCGDEQRVEGILLNYVSGNIVLLSENGIYHIPYKDILFMKPIIPIIEKFNKEYADVVRLSQGYKV